MSLMLLLAKALVVWCAADTELATAAIDLGFLLFVGPFAIASVLNPFARGMHQIICEVVLTHLVIGEIISNAVVLPMIDRQTSYILSWGMWDLLLWVPGLVTGSDVRAMTFLPIWFY